MDVSFSFSRLAFILLFLFLLCLFPMTTEAAEPVSFGEIMPSGSVQIESSSGKWIEVRGAYPLLRKTRMRTNNGVAFISASDGSRFDLSKGTEASLDSSNRIYAITLNKGTLVFSVVSGTLLTVESNGKGISVFDQNASVAGPTKGMVYADSRGLSVKTLSGNVKLSACEGRVLKSGESISISHTGPCRYAGFPSHTGGTESLMLQGLIGGAFVTGGTVIAIESYRGEGFQSPSTPR